VIPEVEGGRKDKEKERGRRDEKDGRERCNNRLLFYMFPGQSKHFGLSIQGMVINSRLYSII